MEGKMRPSSKFIPSVLDYNADSRGPTFYNFTNSDDKGEGDIPRQADKQIQRDVDSDGEDNDDAAIPEDDHGL